MRAHVFDMDGTLLHGTSAPVLLATALGQPDARGEHACLITMSPLYFAEPLDESAILNPRDKPRLAEAFCAEHGLTLADAIAYGDSMSDVFLFAEAGVRISVNGDHHLADRVDAAVEGTDLLVAYRAARALID